MIDSRDLLAAKRWVETAVLVPASPKIAGSGGVDFNDHRLIRDRRDRVHAKHPDIVLPHGGSPMGAERIAGHWVNYRKVPQIALQARLTKHAKAAPFKRNDATLKVLPVGPSVLTVTGFQKILPTRRRSTAVQSGDLMALPHRRFLPPTNLVDSPGRR
jgi:hypothetical protein